MTDLSNKFKTFCKEKSHDAQKIKFKILEHQSEIKLGLRAINIAQNILITKNPVEAVKEILAVMQDVDHYSASDLLNAASEWHPLFHASILRALITNLNSMDKFHPAILRPGRIDLKIKLSSLDEDVINSIPAKNYYHILM